jgi:Flp pilus assembly protein TadB
MFRKPHATMHHEQNRFQTAFSAAPTSLAGRLLGFAGAVIAAILAFMFSLAALAVVAVVGALLGGWLWWKTRAVRRQMQDAMQAQAQQRPPGGYIIEGEVVREPETAVIRRLPE